MEYLFNDWKRIKDYIGKSPRVLLLADYDGTLTPIVSEPKDAILNKSLRKILKILSKKKRFYIGIISGRKLDDVKRLTNINKIIYYAGNHGLEIKGPNIKFVHPLCKKFRPYLVSIKKELLTRTKDIKGAIIEYKGASLSLHYRLVRKKHIKRLRSIFNKVCAPYIRKSRIKLSSGKKVWEVKMPVDWNKGDAVSKILAALKPSGSKILPIYLGDDITDEDAFSFLKNKKSLTVFVGKGRKGKAKYYLNSPYEVKKFLVRLCQV